MYKYLYILSFLLLGTGNTLVAQQGVYVPAGATVWLSENTNVGIFSDMINNGILGSNPNAAIYFLSQRWTNGNGSTLPDESTDGTSGKGGTFHFINVNPVYGNIGRQTIFGGYNLSAKQGASFPNLVLNNPAGVMLDDLSDLKIRNTLHFINGHIYLNGWNLQVGEKTPGTIIGYNDKKFVVNGTGFGGGALYRAGLNEMTDKVVFPVGTADGGYSPAAILLSGATDMFGVRAFDSVYTVAAGGVAYTDSFVNKTWNIRRIDNTGGDATVILQHMDAMELPVYTIYRDSSFVTHFVGGVWDQVPFIPAKPLSGNLTTSSMFEPATMHMRNFSGLGASEYFAKTTLMGAAKPVTFLSFEAYRITPVMVQLNWTTSREISNAMFEVERRYENEETFTKIVTVPTKAVNGNSNIPLNYTYQDLNDYDDWTYYRIKAVGRNNKWVYSEIRAVPPFVQINVFPNPNDGAFKIKIRGLRGDKMMQLRNTWSQVVRQFDIKADTDVQISELPAGIYYLVIYYKGTLKTAYTCKIIVTQ